MTKTEKIAKAKQLKEQLESITGKRVKLIKEGASDTHEIKEKYGNYITKIIKEIAKEDDVMPRYAAEALVKAISELYRLSFH